MLKKLIVFVVLGLVTLPASTAQAAVVLLDPAGEMIDNVMNAESVDFSLGIDVETDNESLQQPITIHADLDGVSDSEKMKAAFDFNFWSTDQNGKFTEDGGSAVLTAEKLYLSGSENEWYFLRNNAFTEIVSDANTDENIEEAKQIASELFDRGVFTYKTEAIEVINKKMTVRYAYTVNNDRLISYFVEKGLDSDEAEELRAAADDVVIGGKFWVDTKEMLPVMVTMNVDANTDEASYTKFSASLLFKSFDEPVSITVPKNAVSAEEYYKNTTKASSSVMMTSLENTIDNMDADGDGLTNEDEETIWHTNPMLVDSDGDKYNDRIEVMNGYNPNGKGKLDTDDDGLSDYNEMTIHWTDRLDADTDNDGYNDGLEIKNGYNPNGKGRW